MISIVVAAAENRRAVDPIAGVPTSAVAPTMAVSTAGRSVARSLGAIVSASHTREPARLRRAVSPLTSLGA